MPDAAADWRLDGIDPTGALARSVGLARQAMAADLVTRGDGWERGVRSVMLQNDRISIEVVVDRSLDIASARIRQIPDRLAIADRNRSALVCREQRLRAASRLLRRPADDLRAGSHRGAGRAVGRAVRVSGARHGRIPDARPHQRLAGAAVGLWRARSGWRAGGVCRRRGHAGRRLWRTSDPHPADQHRLRQRRHSCRRRGRQSRLRRAARSP